MDVILQIGGKVVTSPYGVEVTWKKTMFADEDDKTIRFFLTVEEQNDCIDRLRNSSKVKSIRKVSR